MSLYQLMYHFVWTTKERERMIEPKYEDELYDTIRTKAAGLGALVYALNGTRGHVHMVASVPPRISLSNFIGQVKGVASALFNAAHGDELSFRWQSGYGVFSLGKEDLKRCIRYVEGQKRHHETGSTIALFERTQE